MVLPHRFSGLLIRKRGAVGATSSAWVWSAHIAIASAHRVPFIVTELGADVDPFVLHLFGALAQKERALISQRTKQGLQAAKKRGVKLGGWTAGSERSKKEAAALAERMRPVIRELARSFGTAGGGGAKPAENIHRDRRPVVRSNSHPVARADRTESPP